MGTRESGGLRFLKQIYIQKQFRFIPVFLLCFTGVAASAPLPKTSTTTPPPQKFIFAPPPPSLHCAPEKSNIHYSSLYNTTSLQNCTGPIPRKEKFCIVGAGSSGIHLGWLLKRRGFNNTVIFESRNRTGGDVWTYNKDKKKNKNKNKNKKNPPLPLQKEEENAKEDGITRELGAAFLSPDYDEVRGLLLRYNMSEVPISVTKEMNFHKGKNILNVNNNTETAKQWYSNWIYNITGIKNTTKQNLQVSAALNKYNSLHMQMFGAYSGRFPPQPSTTENLELLANTTALDFLYRYDLHILEPLMYQFFVMQGMGLLGPMSSYYMLKWCSPKSMAQGGFGNDHDTPLAMLKDGYGMFFSFFLFLFTTMC